MRNKFFPPNKIADGSPNFCEINPAISVFKHYWCCSVCFLKSRLYLCIGSGDVLARMNLMPIAHNVISKIFRTCLFALNHLFLQAEYFAPNADFPKFCKRSYLRPKKFGCQIPFERHHLLRVFLIKCLELPFVYFLTLGPNYMQWNARTQHCKNAPACGSYVHGWCFSWKKNEVSPVLPTPSRSTVLADAVLNPLLHIIGNPSDTVLAQAYPRGELPCLLQSINLRER